VIGILAVDGWAVTFGTTRRGLGGLRPHALSPLLAVPNVAAHPSTAGVPTSYYSLVEGPAARFSFQKNRRKKTF